LRQCGAGYHQDGARQFHHSNLAWLRLGCHFLRTTFPAAEVVKQADPKKTAPETGHRQ